MQVWPALTYLPQAMRGRRDAEVGVVGTMTGLLPPSSSTVGGQVLGSSLATIRPTAVEPVKKMWSKGCSSSAVASGAALDDGDGVGVEVLRG